MRVLTCYSPPSAVRLPRRSAPGRGPGPGRARVGCAVAFDAGCASNKMRASGCMWRRVKYFSAGLGQDYTGRILCVLVLSARTRPRHTGPASRRCRPEFPGVPPPYYSCLSKKPYVSRAPAPCPLARAGVRRPLPAQRGACPSALHRYASYLLPQCSRVSGPAAPLPRPCLGPTLINSHPRCVPPRMSRSVMCVRRLNIGLPLVCESDEPLIVVLSRPLSPARYHPCRP